MSVQALNKSDLGFDYRIVRSGRRRTISIEVREARVLVRSPMGIAEVALHQLVRDRQAWVRGKLAAQREQIARVPEYSYLGGSRMPWLGRELTLVLGEAGTSSVRRLGDQLQVVHSRRSPLDGIEQTRRLVAQWYREQALVLLRDKTRALAHTMGLSFRAVTVRATRSKWGHCTSRGALQYNWHIVLAPEPVVDYLVAHEVCHLRHPNHSRAFWQLVESVCPDYSEQRAWLKAHGRCLVL